MAPYDRPECRDGWPTTQYMNGTFDFSVLFLDRAECDHSRPSRSHRTSVQTLSHRQALETGGAAGARPRARRQKTPSKHRLEPPSFHIYCRTLKATLLTPDLSFSNVLFKNGWLHAAGSSVNPLHPYINEEKIGCPKGAILEIDV